MQKKIIPVLFIFFLAAGIQTARAQNPNNPLLYSHQSVLFGDQGAAHDPVSIVMPGTAYAAGFGSFLDNPASIALFKQSFGEFGFSIRNVNEQAGYLDASESLDSGQTNLSNAGFIYRFPTTKGSFVIGGGYNQHAVFNRALGFDAKNEQNTITDEFKWDGSPYQEIAYEAYATDYGDEVGDWDESILRVGFDQPGEFYGMRQQGEIIQKGYAGEYSVFFATEFQKNFMIGASAGLISGRFDYTRTFLEIDELDDYNSDFIETDEGLTDIDTILLDDRILSRYTGFKGRAGAIYRVSDVLQFGGSYTFPTRLNVDEEFDAEITSTMDNGEFFRRSAVNDFSYSVKYPSKTSLGVSLNNISGFSVSFAADYTDYSQTEIEFDDSSMFEDEQAENEFITDTYRPVWSFRGGIAYDINPFVTLRGGYGTKPSRFEDGDDDREIYSFGAGFHLSRDIRLELGAQYTAWDEVSSVYDYAEYDYSPLPDNLPSVSFSSQEASRSAERWNVMATLRFNFY